MPISTSLCETPPLLDVQDLYVSFELKGHRFNAVEGVSLQLYPGETLGLVGESGCGKSTLTRAILRLVDTDRGSIKVNGVEWTTLSRRQMIPKRKVAQLVFQDSLSSLDPRWTVGRLLEEPLVIHEVGTASERRDLVLEILSAVGLQADAVERFPHQFSGGQRQRINIARALILRPSLLICDEPVSALDVSVQAQILNLLVDLQQRLGVAYLFVSHDLAVVEYMSDRLAVMEKGKIVETGSANELLTRAIHPYTQKLLRSAGYDDFDEAGVRSRHDESLVVAH
ncbi:ABC transporter ATP-binding protein [Pseudomonas helleri]|uniref:ABC transporter ATP-binding protein n=1 Tax=Pseudomonas helleri TaxID=1608996 RepID=UPI00334265FE